jgi:hypothetical protein
MSKRRIFKSLAAPYRPLSDSDKLPEAPSVYVRKLPGTERPRDSHFIYTVILVEIDDAACSIPIGEKSSIHTSIIENVEGRSLITSYILIRRSCFSTTDSAQLTERLLCIAHELLYFVQYPSIVRIHGGQITDEILKSNTRIPNPDEECDLVCSFVTIAEFLQSIYQTLGIQIRTVENLAEFQQSTVGQRRFNEFWVAEKCVCEEIAYDRIREYIELRIHDASHDLQSMRETCSQTNNATCVNQTESLQHCSPCNHFDDLTKNFKTQKNEHLSIDRDLLSYLVQFPIERRN